MHTDEPREVQGVELGYDPRDIDERRIYKIVFWFFIIAIVHFGFGAIIYTHYGFGRQAARDPRKPDIVGPKVQGNVAAKVDIMDLRQMERREMETYDLENGAPKVSPEGTVRIPVERAMALIAQRGLPAVTSDEHAVSPGTTIRQNAVGPGTGTPDQTNPGNTAPAAPSTPTTPADSRNIPTPQVGEGATGTTAGGGLP